MIQNDLTHRERALRLVQDRGIVRARDFTAAGIPLVYLKRLCDSGDIFRLSRGLYQDPNRLGEHAAHDLAEAARRVPNGVISLISALHYHQLTTQLPHAVWMTIPHKARTPQAQGLRLEFVRATGEVMSAGIEHISVEGVLVPIFCPAKTVADCFKHRRIVGEDVAVEALKDAIRQRKATPSELMRFAAINRVAERVALYLRALQ
ncbi:type IV toxin-antitoxin system AbiEi family antitoxin domain-containing protein [Pseudomonas sp. PDM19]|uniref:type IV toxin-antitoxin system AbiEi family antitoxin domain-containing protein n=1 Tax=Pseudomonas sp. PDM19 TaxID=2769272 RepID=UPI0017865D8E|nr:type IV toxin-antitoxin system AbiEi family antitoxin domain-containing protein [Pseudomonas sp. PDM19]MBD9634610.1 type IV toxin-antitoxin system AbiEi family antitoxin domain-containing protein [Pseudomonas sp. PDM19]